MERTFWYFFVSPSLFVSLLRHFWWANPQQPYCYNSSEVVLYGQMMKIYLCSNLHDQTNTKTTTRREVLYMPTPLPLPVFFLLYRKQKRSLLQPPPLLPLSLHVKVSRSPNIYPSQFWNPIFLHLGLRKQLFVFFNYWERSFSSPTTPQDSIGGTPQYTWRRA